MKGRRIIKSTLIIISACVLFIAGFFFFNSLIQKKIRQQLTNLSPELQITFASVHTNFFSSSVSFNNLEINFAPYNNRKQNQHHFYFPQATLRDISFLKFLLNKNLAGGNFSLEKGDIQLDQYLLDKKDSAQSEILKEIKWPFKKLYIKSLELKGTKVFLHSHTSKQLIATGDIMLGGISVKKASEPPGFATVDVLLSDINYPISRSVVLIRRLSLNSRKKTAEVDSLRILSGDYHQNETQISNIKITAFDFVDLIKNKIMKAERVMVGNSKVFINTNERLTLKSLPLNLKGIFVNVFQSENAFVTYSDKKNKFSFNTSVHVDKLKIDSSFNSGNFHFAFISGKLSDVHYSGDNYHNVEIRNIEVDSRKEMIQIADLKIIPRLRKYEFAGKLGHQSDWVDADISKIVIIKPSFSQLFQQRLIAEKIDVGESKAYVFRDRRLPRIQKIIPLPVEYLKTIPIDIRVKTLELATSGIAYEEYPKQGFGQTGILRIEKIRATLSPLVNHPTASDPPFATMKVVGSIMGSGSVNGTIIMPLRKNIPYRIRGTIERLELTKLNSSSENLGKIRIKSGFLDFLYFDFTMTTQRSTGKIIGAYHKLIIQQLKKHTEEKNVADFASFMLRHLIIPLDKDKSLPERKRTGLVNYQRDPTRFMSHYFLQSLLMGVKKSFTLGFLLPK